MRQPGISINKEEIPASTVDHTEWLARIYKSFNGGDLGIAYFNGYDDNRYLRFNEVAPSGDIVFTPSHRRIQVYGITGNFVADSWLFKFETAYKSGLAVQSNGIVQVGNGKDIWKEKDIIQAMVGFEYNGISDLMVTYEITGTKINNYENALYDPETSVGHYLSLKYDMAHQTLHPQFIWSRLPDNNGDIFRVTIDYDVRDALQLSLSAIFYESCNKDELLYPFRNNDRISTSIKYSF